MKKINIVILSLTFFCLWTFISCNPPLGATVRYIFKIKNNSGSKILYQVSEIYPDTAIQDLDKSRVGDISLMGLQTIDSKIPWPKYFQGLRSDTLSIFFVSQDTIFKYGWEQVQNRYLVLKRKDISFKDLEESNYLITYP